MNFQTRYAAKILSVGGVISNPTDTVQGLTCLPYEKSMQKMFSNGVQTLSIDDYASFVLSESRNLEI
jgi:hypothetical protein